MGDLKIILPQVMRNRTPCSLRKQAKIVLTDKNVLYSGNQYLLFCFTVIRLFKLADTFFFFKCTLFGPVRS